MQIEPQNNQTSLTPNHQLHQEALQANRPLRTVPVLIMEDQGKSTLDEYVRYCKSRIAPALTFYEKEVVKTAVSGISDEYIKGVLIAHLEHTKWTWANAEKELARISLHAKTTPQVQKRRRGM